MNTELHQARPRRQDIGILLLKELEKVQVSGSIEARIATRRAVVDFSIKFYNTTEKSQEVTFAIPDTGEVLEAKASLDDREVKMKVLASETAEEAYERALQNGDSPALIDPVGEDVRVLHFGRISKGEKAAIALKLYFPLKYGAEGSELRIPTVLGPRYGQPGDAKRGTAMADASFLAEQQLKLKVVMAGSMQDVNISSPSHPLVEHAHAPQESQRIYHPKGRAFMDRDIVLKFGRIKAPASGMVSRDSRTGNHVAWIDVTSGKSTSRNARKLHVLVDCSGSMSGDGIDIARSLLQSLAKSLGNNDSVSLSRFGSTCELVFSSHPAGVGNALLETASGLQTDMGGTELSGAIREVIGNCGEDTDIVLLTDGLVHEGEELVEDVRRQGSRIFAVGIGAAPRGSLLEAMAKATEGHAEFIGANEEPQEVALSIVEKTGITPRRITRIDWDGYDPIWKTPLPQAIQLGVPFPVGAEFSGDDGRPQKAMVAINGEDPLEVPLVDADCDKDLSELMARSLARRKAWQEKIPEKRIDLALKYGFLVPGLSMVGIVERKHKDRSEAEGIVLPPMLSAGYGGISSSRSGPAVHKSTYAYEKAENSHKILDLARKAIPESLAVCSYSLSLEDWNDSTWTYQFIKREHENLGRVPRNLSRHWYENLDHVPNNLPRRCPYNFLLAENAASARKAISKYLVQIWDMLSYEYGEEMVWVSFREAVLLHFRQGSETHAVRHGFEEIRDAVRMLLHPKLDLFRWQLDLSPALTAFLEKRGFSRAGLPGTKMKQGRRNVD